MYTYICIYIHTHTYIYIYTYIYYVYTTLRIVLSGGAPAGNHPVLKPETEMITQIYKYDLGYHISCGLDPDGPAGLSLPPRLFLCD